MRLALEMEDKFARNSMVWRQQQSAATFSHELNFPSTRILTTSHHLSVVDQLDGHLSTLVSQIRTQKNELELNKTNFLIIFWLLVCPLKSLINNKTHILNFCNRKAVDT